MIGMAHKLLFTMGPERAHSVAMGALGAAECSGAVRSMMARRSHAADSGLEVRTMGLIFRNPVGLAGGFDKNATRPRALAALGFGFLELGTVTAEAQAPNPAPNLFRLSKDHALINRLGFPNEGAKVVCERIARAKADIDVPVGVSIGKSRRVPAAEIDRVIDDYVTSFEYAARVADFIVVNVSSPNTADLRSLQGASYARALLAAILAKNTKALPVLVKVAPDLEDPTYAELLDVIAELGLAGVIATNTTIKRTGLSTPESEVQAIGAGGLSGPPLRSRALAMVSAARKRLGNSATVIGVGGISNGEHAKSFLDAGADLLQIYTGFIYGGPFLAAEINEYLMRHRA